MQHLQRFGYVYNTTDKGFCVLSTWDIENWLNHNEKPTPWARQRFTLERRCCVCVVEMRKHHFLTLRTTRRPISTSNNRIDSTKRCIKSYQFGDFFSATRQGSSPQRQYDTSRYPNDSDVLPHLTSLPDLAPSDFHIFHNLRGVPFNTDVELGFWTNSWS